jgi:hypothetical protein
MKKTAAAAWLKAADAAAAETEEGTASRRAESGKGRTGLKRLMSVTNALWVL